ncbi:hypothetical protein DEU56DRAFT_809284 [Suillus clintonianus]|uniref:uncharacterized protein n=1 Tax=Suillus clintonianus TaxID=1904413 RepID=UPI001B87106D|nr:uncharacterized protein DEU56DRAFT_809284 [Suillus clintonianus]KAG2134477.1 hypothetical protein DEU56DRAFT_809284 [Suillus clintonianus]
MVDFSQRRSERDSSYHSTLPSYIFRPLLKFRRLSIVKFVAVGNYHLNDWFIEGAGAAWPDLLELKFIPAEPVTSQVTFTAVLPLVSRCRSLHSLLPLHPAFDATHLPTLPHAPHGNWELWRAHTALRELHVGNSKAAEAADVFFLLAKVFPNLADLAWCESLNPSDVTVWKEIIRLWNQQAKLWKPARSMAASLSDFLLEPPSEAEDWVGEDGDWLQGE